MNHLSYNVLKHDTSSQEQENSAGTSNVGAAKIFSRGSSQQRDMADEDTLNRSDHDRTGNGKDSIEASKKRKEPEGGLSPAPERTPRPTTPKPALTSGITERALRHKTPDKPLLGDITQAGQLASPPATTPLSPLDSIIQRATTYNPAQPWDPIGMFGLLAARNLTLQEILDSRPLSAGKNTNRPDNVKTT